MVDQGEREIPREWLERAARQEERWKQMSGAERKAWGFTGRTPKEQAKIDEAKQTGEDVWLLTIIDREGHTAEMGGLMYELPSPGIIGGARRVELAIAKVYEFLTKKPEVPGVQVEIGQPPKGQKEKQYPRELLNFALYHRNGHMQGLRRFQEETTTALLDALLDNAQQKGNFLEPKAIIYQVAALIESAGDNADLRRILSQRLQENSFWRSEIVGKDATNGLKIPGLNEQEITTLFPGAESVVLPKPTQSKLNPLFNRWQRIVADTTYSRALLYVNGTQAASQGMKIATEIAKEIEATV